MPYYLILSKLTGKGNKTMMDNPERIYEVNEEIEKMGAKIISQYALLGSYSFMTVINAASMEVVLRVTANLASRETIEPTTFAAMPVEELVKEIGLAKAMR